MAKSKPTPPRKRSPTPNDTKQRKPSPPVPDDDISDGTVVGEMELDTNEYELPLSRT